MNCRHPMLFWDNNGGSIFLVRNPFVSEPITLTAGDLLRIKQGGTEGPAPNYYLQYVGTPNVRSNRKAYRVLQQTPSSLRVTTSTSLQRKRYRRNNYQSGVFHRKPLVWDRTLRLLTALPGQTLRFGSSSLTAQGQRMIKDSYLFLLQ